MKPLLCFASVLLLAIACGDSAASSDASLGADATASVDAGVVSDPRCVDFVDTVVIGCDSSGIEREVRDESIAACSLMNDATIDACIACGELEACSMAVWSCIQAQCPFFSEE